MKITRRKLLAACCAAALLCNNDSALATWASFQDYNSAVSPAWQEIAIGGGGYVSGMDIGSDGTMAVRCDTYGAYVWDPSLGSYPTNKWYPALTATSIPAAFLLANGMQQDSGVYEIKIAPSNSSIMYMAWQGYVWYSSNKGKTWTQTASLGGVQQTFPNYSVGPTNPNNIGFAYYGSAIAIHPTNPAIAYVGFPGGLFYTTNSGESWTAVSTSSVPASADWTIYVAIDPATPTTVYALSGGNGVYKSTNSGSTWSSISSGGPATGHNLVQPVVTGGNLYCIDIGTSGSSSAGGNLWCYSGSWSERTSDGIANSIAIDPSTSGHAILLSAGYSVVAMALNETFNLGPSATFSGWSEQGVMNGGTDVPWFDYVTAQGFSASQLVFSRTESDTLFASGGVGVYTTTLSGDITTSESITFNSQTRGIEQLVCTTVLGPNANSPVCFFWDTAIFYKGNMAAGITGSYPSDWAYDPALCGAWCADYASSNTDFLCAIVDSGPPYGSHNEYSAYSTNGGQTWTAFAAVPSNVESDGSLTGPNGCIAASTPENMVWYPAGLEPSYTTNGGSTWSSISASGVTWPSFGNYNGRPVCADRVAANTFYMMIASESGGNESYYGIWKSTNSGATWTQEYATTSGDGPILSNGNFGMIAAAPGLSGTLIYTPTQYSYASAAFGYCPLSVSTNGGATWNQNPSSADTMMWTTGKFGYGASASGQTWPAVFAVGWVSNFSTSSITIPSSGSLPTTINLNIPAGLGNAFVPGAFVTINEGTYTPSGLSGSSASPSTTDYIAGTITSYNNATGALVIDALVSGGSGTFSSWTVGTYGTFVSYDGLQTWIQLGIPDNSLDQVASVSGDLGVVGQCYVGFSGSSCATMIA